MQKFIKKLIERLEEEKQKDVSDAKFYRDTKNEKLCIAYTSKARAFQDAISIVNQLAEEYRVSEMPTGWITVSERLPKEDFYCIVTVEYTNGNKEVNFGWFDRASVCWYVGAGEFRTTNVLAWMPFPAPYTEGE